MLERPHIITYTISFLLALVVANLSGPQYVYPIFGTSLTTTLRWSAVENSLVSTATFVGMSFSGPLCAWMVERLGIASTLRISGLVGFLGPFLLAQTYLGHLPNYMVLCVIYLAATGIAGSAGYLCALDSQSHNFKSHPGLTLGVTSTAIGVCGVVFSQINEHFFKETDGDNVAGFILFWGTAMLIGLFAGSFVLGPIEPENEKEITGIEETPLLIEEHIPVTQPKDYEITGKALLTDPFAIALFCTLFMTLGLGYVYLTSIGQLLLSLPATPASAQHLRNVHVSLFSAVNCSARALFGLISDVLKRRYGIHRIWMLWLAAAVMLLSLLYLVIAVSTAEALIPATIMIATVYGLAFGVTPAAISEFGRKVFARNWGWMLYAPAISSQIFNVVFGILYDYEARRLGVDICEGVGCFRPTFIIGAVFTFLCLLVVSWAIVREKLYKRQGPYA
ncbi:hypothetical protein DFQ28_000085 [Apophysomyces sp. BC1034]|nr:hypothetical protein DFQ30_006686 [Apophysomyces sp. BC1015]KAG0183214.1 hypothetical protein DFQ29_008574 [Apophysomyces sp. BC1021]KAG0194387.1 hypothetical protein DFQ28_000085 [Apophysomyces sp. BC1034]